MRRLGACRVSASVARTPIRGVHYEAHRASAEKPLTLTDERDGIRRVVLANANKRNCLSLDMIRQLKNDLLAHNNNQLRIIILSAEGPVFCSGHDLKELTSARGSDMQKQVFTECTELMHGIRNLSVPVICQVNGLAAAAGLQLMATCDIVLATRSSHFSTPGVNFGLFCTTPGVALARNVPAKVAMPMLLTGEPIDAEQALLHGLLSDLADNADMLEQKTMQLSSSILAKSKDVIALGKFYFYEQLHDQSKRAYEIGCDGMLKNLEFDSCQEGLQAFAEKRKPKWI